MSAREHLTNLTVMMALHDITEHPEEDKGAEGPPDLVDDADIEVSLFVALSVVESESDDR